MNSATTLPDAEEMMRRLRSVIDEPHAVKNLYPKITANAGEPKTRDGMELMFLLAFRDYAGTLPAVHRGLMVALPDFMRVMTDGV